MRLWSLHPSYLDTKGLVALWREGLLAQKVLQGQTKGYTNHPQLLRFKQTANPLHYIAYYLSVVQMEATQRGYKFDASKIVDFDNIEFINVTSGQIDYEVQHLHNKLQQRDPIRYETLQTIDIYQPHPLFKVIQGEIESWEIVS